MYKIVWVGKGWLCKQELGEEHHPYTCFYYLNEAMTLFKNTAIILYTCASRNFRKEKIIMDCKIFFSIFKVMFNSNKQLSKVSDIRIN